MKAFRSTLLLTLVVATPLAAQTFRTPDPVLRQIWSLGMDSSQTQPLAQALFDSIGMRLSGTTGFSNAVEWIQARYRSWNVPVRQEQYATTRGWRMGAVAMVMTAPHVQTLETHLLAFSPGTPGGRPVDGDAVVIPLFNDSLEAKSWLPNARGKFVLVSAPVNMCRAPQELERYARPETVARVNAERQGAQRDFFQRIRAFGGTVALHRALQDAGALGIVTSLWSGGWGVDKIFNANADRIPTVDISCEDYGMVYRLASNNQHPRLRLSADAEARPDQPMFNVIAELRGSELPNEYVILGAHLDSWHGATGATDNGTGTITMLEAARILSIAYPHPRRTILIGHWGGEEQGDQGSFAFAEDHPGIIDSLQVAFNQDNGTWRFEIIEGQGFMGASQNLAGWIAKLPNELSSGISLRVPGNQENQGSDHSAFICHGAPAFRLQSPYDEYRQYTWHTNRDTFDKIVFDDLRQNATTAAMLAYLASEDPQRTPRDRAVLPNNQSGQPRSWMTCGTVRRSPAQQPGR